MYKLSQHGGNGCDNILDTANLDLAAWYNPLDFFSGDVQRVEHAIRALFNDWTNDSGHMHMFVDGIRMPYNKAQAYIPWLRQSSTACTRLSKEVSQTLTEPVNQTVLLTLVRQQQRLDPYDIEGIAQMWEALEGEALACAHSGAFPPITLSDYEWIAQHPVPVAADKDSLTRADLRHIIAGYLLSATLKDVSLFIGMNDNETRGDVLQTNHARVHIVDLDPKRVSKLRNHAQNDNNMGEYITRLGM